MTMPTPLRMVLVVVLVLTASACGSDESSPRSSLEDAGDVLDETCPSDTPPFNFGPHGLSAVDETSGVKVFLEDASSKPPFYGTNDWTIAITDMNGTPMSEATLTWACAFMSLHGHGSNPKRVEKLGDGRYRLLKQNLAMSGQWEIRLWIDPTGAAEAYTGGIGSARSVCSMSGEPLVLRACVPRSI